MEHQNGESEFVFVHRAVGVPLRRTDAPHETESRAPGAEPPDDAPRRTASKESWGGEAQSNGLFAPDPGTGEPVESRVVPARRMTSDPNADDAAAGPPNASVHTRLSRASGETRWLLLQIAAALVLLAAVLLGTKLGGDAFRRSYTQVTARHSVSLSTLFEPIEPVSSHFDVSSSESAQTSSAPEVLSSMPENAVSGGAR